MSPLWLLVVQQEGATQQRHWAVPIPLWRCLAGKVREGIQFLPVDQKMPSSFQVASIDQSRRSIAHTSSLRPSWIRFSLGLPAKQRLAYHLLPT